MSSLTINKLNSIVENCLGQNLNDYDTFVETGTLLGDTVINLHSCFNNLHTIELSEKYFNISKNRIDAESIKNINSHFGDSSLVVPNLLKNIDLGNTIFFLDGHWSSGDTAQGNKDCPLVEECLAIDKFYKGSNLIILIDDYRLFETKLNEDWSAISLEAIRSCFNKYRIEVESVYDDVLGFYLTGNNGTIK
jgi:hypothetical protein